MVNLDSRHEQRARVYKTDAIRVAKKFNATNDMSSLYRLAEMVVGLAYLAETDKGDLNEPLSMHVRRVHDRVLDKYTGRVTPDVLTHLQILAMMHEILEIKDEGGVPVWGPKDLKKIGFPPAIVAEIEALAKRPNELYLDYVQRLAQFPYVVMVKLPDLQENQSPERHQRSPYGAGQKFVDKKELLYPMSEIYLEAVIARRIDPRQVSVMDFIQSERDICLTHKQMERLGQYTLQKPTAFKFAKPKRLTA